MSRQPGRRWSVWTVVPFVIVCFCVIDATVLAMSNHYGKATFRLATALLVIALDGWDLR